MGIHPSQIKWHHLYKLFFLFQMICGAYGDVGSDKSVLLQFRSSVSDSSGALASWDSHNSVDYCSWTGVACDNSSRVLALNITGSGRGNSSPFSCSSAAKFPLYGFGIRRKCSGNNVRLVGKLSPVIAKLTELRVLSLPFNALSGVIPDEIWAMEKLEVLDLEGNQITGALPHQIGGLSNLRFLNLAFNGIYGAIPPLFSNCVHLEILNLAGNQLNGTFPGYVTELSEIRGLYLSFNQLYGPVPRDIGKYWMKLEHLDLSGNFFTNGIPNSLGNCTQLQTLLLYSNLFDEVIPGELGQLGSLKVLDVSRNSLSGFIPPELGNCSNLAVLVLSNLFDPTLKTRKAKEDSSLLQSLNPFNDDYNYFQGNIPLEITTLPQLKVIWAPRATLDGILPSDWGACRSLEMVNLGQNFFHGEIPVGLSRCDRLRFLDLSLNRLSGELLDRLPVPCMAFFDVSGNLFSGPIPIFSPGICTSASSSVISAFQPDKVSYAYTSFFIYRTQIGNPYLMLLGRGRARAVLHKFDSNNFTGLNSLPIPSGRVAQQTVYSFSAGGNMLSVELPGDLFKNCNGVSALVVNISENMVSGQLPTNIGAICNSLKFFDASRNQITGSIPLTIGDLVHLVLLNLSSNQLHGEIPASLSQVKGLQFLSLANNNLSGPIPSSLGELHSLEQLELSSNSISGEIPKGIANLSNLTTLLLNYNELCGQIPFALANVTSLSAFNASYNNLSGILPLNGNLKCSSVIANPLLEPCPVSPLAVPSSDARGTGDPQTYAASPPRGPSSSTESNSFTSIEIASITSASAIVAVLLALVILFVYTRNWKPRSAILRSSRKEVTVFSDIGVPVTFENVVRATGSFNATNCIGNGGFGATYKAEISPGVLVAIKRLAVGRFQGIQQFHAEIKTLGRLRHQNLVTLIGYHASETEMFLIYNYLPGGNLEKFIQERCTRAVDWKILHKIALDIARALAYLHDQCVPRVLHRDVKPSNILLDDDFNAYLSDFGLARLLGTSETHATTGVAGTFGYVAPEYAMTCRVSDKADVYSYGVVLLELLSDKKALDPSFSSYGNGFNIVAWASMLLRQGRAKEFFVAGLWDAGPHDDLVEVLHLAVVCTVESLTTRPTMRQVVRRLKQLQPPSC